MQLSEWAEREGRGSLTRLHRLTGVAYSVLWAIAKAGHRLKREDKARAISAGTGGLVPVSALLEQESPEGKAS